MTVYPKRRFTPGDAIVLLALLAAGVLLTVLSLVSPAGDAFTITSDSGRAVYSLREEQSLEIVSGGVHLTVEVRDGAVSVTSSDCPDHVCQRTGAISRAGQSIVCVPGGVVISIPQSGGDSHEAHEDWIVG